MWSQLCYTLLDLSRTGLLLPSNVCVGVGPGQLHSSVSIWASAQPRRARMCRPKHWLRSEYKRSDLVFSQPSLLLCCYILPFCRCNIMCKLLPNKPGAEPPEDTVHRPGHRMWAKHDYDHVERCWSDVCMFCWLLPEHRFHCVHQQLSDQPGPQPDQNAVHSSIIWLRFEYSNTNMEQRWLDMLVLQFILP